MYDASRGFFFYDDASAFHLWIARLSREKRVVEVAAGVRDKASFFRELAAGLSLPESFGHNFDALEECLRDASVLGSHGAVLIHRVPVALATEAFDVYVGVLATAADHWRAAGRPDFLLAAFPVALEASVRTAVALEQERARARDARREEMRMRRAKE